MICWERRFNADSQRQYETWTYHKSGQARKFVSTEVVVMDKFVKRIFYNRRVQCEMAASYFIVIELLIII